MTEESENSDSLRQSYEDADWSTLDNEACSHALDDALQDFDDIKRKYSANLFQIGYGKLIDRRILPKCRPEDLALIGQIYHAIGTILNRQNSTPEQQKLVHDIQRSILWFRHCFENDHEYQATTQPTEIIEIPKLQQSYENENWSQLTANEIQQKVRLAITDIHCILEKYELNYWRRAGAVLIYNLHPICETGDMLILSQINRTLSTALTPGMETALALQIANIQSDLAMLKNDFRNSDQYTQILMNPNL